MKVVNCGSRKYLVLQPPDWMSSICKSSSTICSKSAKPEKQESVQSDENYTDNVSVMICLISREYRKTETMRF